MKSSGRDSVLKIGNLLDFSQAPRGRELVEDCKTKFFPELFERIVTPNSGKFAALRVNLIMEFNPVNAVFALALHQMGARVNWASNDRQGAGIDDPGVMQAVAVISDGQIAPFMVKTRKRNEPWLMSYWASVLQSLTWKEQDGGGVCYPDFIYDPDGLAQSLINLASDFEKNDYTTSEIPEYTKEIPLAIKELLLSTRKIEVAN